MFVDEAMKFLEQNSIIWADPQIRAQIQENYLRAKQVKDSLLEPLAVLIEGVASDCLFILNSYGPRITPQGVERVFPKPSVAFASEEGQAVITVPHFDASRQDEWKGLYEQLHSITDQEEIVIDLRGNEGKNGGLALEFFSKIFGKSYIDSLYYELYKGAVFKWRVSSDNLKRLEQIKPASAAFQAHLDDVIAKMRDSHELTVTTTIPDNEAPEEANPACRFKGKVTLLIDEETRGGAQTLYLLLAKAPHVVIEGKRRPIQRFGEIAKVEFAPDLILHYPRKEEILQS